MTMTKALLVRSAAAMCALCASSLHAASAWVVPPPSTASAPICRRIPSIATTTTTTTTATALSMSQGRGKKSQSTTDSFLNFIHEPLPTLVDADSVTTSPEADDLAPLVRTIASAADKRKAEQIVALRVSKVTAMTTFLVICSGNSRPQNNAIAAAVMDDVAEFHDGLKTRNGEGGAEGTADSGWILLDYGDVMVHIMTPKSRLFYDVEGQWREKGGEEMYLGDVLLPDPMAMPGAPGGGIQGEAEVGGGTMEGLSEEEDPFWS